VTPLADALGSVIGLVNSSGSVVTTYAYDPFGNTTIAGAASANPSQYAGRENEGNGLYFYRARYYSPVLARFINEDPLGLAGSGVNLYAYAWNNPSNFRDPFGLDALADAKAALAQVRADMLDLDDFYGAHPDLLSGRYTSPLPSSCAPGSRLSTGISLSAATVNPFTSQSGGVWGMNRQGSAAGTSWYTYNGTGLGLDVGVSAQSVWASGSGPWTGTFRSINGSAGLFTGSIYWTPGEGGWIGASFGPAIGLPGLAYEQTNYTCVGPS
jgi:RHS repeat-associated protein